MRCSAARCAQRVPVYWSHIGTYRVRNHAVLGVPPLHGYESWAGLGEEARRRGMKAVKTGLVLEGDDGGFVNFGPGFAHTPGYPELNLDRRVSRSSTGSLPPCGKGWARTRN